MEYTYYESLVLFVRGASQNDLTKRLMSIRWLSGDVNCNHCNVQMQICETQSTSDKFRWICMNKGRNTYKTSTSIRNGSFLVDLNHRYEIYVH